MRDEEFLINFTEGFAKTAESYGFTGEQVKDLMKLAINLSVQATHPEEFASGYIAALGE